MKPRELNFCRTEKAVLRSKYFYFAIAGMALIGFWIWSGTGFDYTKEITVINEPSTTSSASPAPRFTILDKIREGIEMLRQSPLLDYETRYYSIKNGVKIKTGDLVRKQIALAILNKNTGEVFEKRFWVKEQDIQNYKKTGILNLEPILSTSHVDNYQHRVSIMVRWWNSFNSYYEIPDQPELVVIANKYPFPSAYISGLPEKSKTKYTDIVYIPYSKSLHLPEIIAAGKKYLDDNVNQAFDQLDSAGIISHSSPGQPVTAVIGKEFIKNIILVEHVDPANFSVAADGGNELTERVFTLIGANQNSAYRYTGSPAGASGLAQFIEPTYKTIVSKYPDARLIKDYNLGMANHINAIKAMVLFFDNYKKEIDNKITRRDAIGQIGITEEMLAAAYNGGANRVVSSVNKYGLAWISSQLNLPRTGVVFKKETLNYIQKFRSIKSLNIF